MKRFEDIEWDPEEYEKWYEKEPGKTIDLIETECALSLILPIKGKKVLDVGCGTGNFTRKLQVLGYEVVGVEPSEPMRRKAVQKGVRCTSGLAEDLPFEKNSFDAVISIAAVEFFKDRLKAVREMLRVVKRRGKVVVCFITGPWAEFYKRKAREGHKVFSHANFPKLDEFSKFASAMKFCLRTPPGEKVSIFDENTKKPAGFVCVLIEK